VSGAVVRPGGAGTAVGTARAVGIARTVGAIGAAALLLTAVLMAVAAGRASAAAVNCRAFPRPGTVAAGPAPANLRAEYSVLGVPRRPADQITRKRLGPLPVSGILPAGIRFLGRASYGGRAFLVPGRHLLASPLKPPACVPRSERALQKALLPSLRDEYSHEALCLVIVYVTQASPTCQPAPGTVAAFLFGPGSPGFGLVPDGVSAVTLHFRGHGPIHAIAHDNFWIVNDLSLLVAPCGLDWTTGGGTVLRTVANCTQDTT
jgi:hypothetical protein